MLPTSLHTIRRQYLEVEVSGSESDGLLLQRNLPALCTQWLLPAIEQALDRCAPEQGALYIERLEIDAGTLKLSRLEYDLPEAVRRALEKVLMEQMVLRADPAMTKARNAKANTYQRKTKQQTLDEALAYFLRTGSLPSSWYLPQGETFEEILLAAWREAAQSDPLLHGVDLALVRALDSEASRERLTLQFSTAFLLVLLTRLSP